MSVCILPGLDTEASGGLRQNVCVLCGCSVKNAAVSSTEGSVCVCVDVEALYHYLSSISSSCVPALNPFEEQENVDARFVEETALKQTLILLGFEEK